MADINKLQEHLRTDAALLEQFLADPAAVLHKYGITLDAQQAQALKTHVQSTLGTSVADPSTIKMQFVFGI